ncbi:MAG: hypothetical protein JW888_15245 [Pirellulales bacterium]|nr:hypothetical protein [Pirellulales bacterium]
MTNLTSVDAEGSRHDRRVVLNGVRVAMVWAVGLVVMAAALPAQAIVVSIGHRGASAIAPENTIASVTAAYGDAWGVECDPRITSDGQIILMHDTTVDRTTDGAYEGAVSGLTFSEIRSLDAGSWFSSAFAGEQVPTLAEELAATSAGGLVACLDIKAGSPAQYLPVIQPYQSQIEIHCFTWSFLETLNALDDGFTLVALGSGDLASQVSSLPTCVDKVSWAYGGITTAGVNAAHAAGKQVYAWTVNSASTMLSLEQMGVDGIVTDIPELATAVLNQPPPVPPVLGDGLPRQLHDGLMMNWNFDEGSGTIAADSVNGIDATLGAGTSTPTWRSGLHGGALQYDGSNDYASVPPELETMPTGNAVTVSAWVKLDRLPSTLSDAYGGVYDSDQDAYVLYLQGGTTDELRFKVTAGAAARPGIPSSQLDTTQWHLVTGVYDGGAGVARIYLDGNLVDVHADDDTAGSDGLVGAVGLQTAFFGRNGTATNGDFDGAIDETAVWDRALGQAEIAYLYNGGAGRTVQESNPTIAPIAPVVRLEFEGNLTNQGTGGATYNGQLINGSQGTITYETGINQQAIHLQNPDSPTNGDGVAVPITLGDVGTISFWCKLDSFYDSQTLFDNSSNADDWKAFVSSAGIATFRLEAGSEVAYDLDAIGGEDRWCHMAVTWFKAGSSAVLNLYVDGLLRDVDEGTWVDPGSTLYIGGGNTLNDFANASFDDFRIYDTMLATDEIVGIYVQKEAGVVRIPGDANSDGTVDEDDSQRLAMYWGKSNARWFMGDFDGDGIVGPKDASILAGNWGQSVSGSATASVPEPTIIIFAITALLMGVVMGRKQHLGRG